MKTKLTSMKTQLRTPHNGSRTCAMTEPVAGRKPVLALLMRLLWAAALVLPAFGAQAAAVLTTLHSFQVWTNGESPYAGLVQGSDGNFYGTTLYGGTNGYGTVFQISTNRALTTLYSFTGGDGAYPQTGLVQGSDGNFYGTTGGGGTNNAGTVFKISANGALTSLYSFTGGSDGANPLAGLVQGSDGSFYGTTYSGGTNGVGTVFRISTNGALTSLHLFSGDDGANPQAGLVQGSDGSFYGTTLYGGNINVNYGEGYGTVFKISSNGALTSLYSFSGGDGVYPQAALVQGSDGNFYGTTGGGRSFEPIEYHFGTVFRISSNGALTTLYSFTGGDDGGHLDAALVQGSDGNFYGTTVGGGNTNLNGGYGYGTVFQISSNGALTSSYSFTGGNDGGYPSGLVQGSDGNFYGTTQSGGTTYYNAQTGTYGFGTVFKISTHGTLTSLYSFTSPNDGARPSGLVQGSDGNFYGTTSSGGNTDLNNPGGYGTVFKISINGALTTLYSFTGGNGGANPSAGLVQGNDGNFYGTTSSGGTNNSGTVFQISSNGALTNLYSFTGGNDGANPTAGLVQGSDGYFYGTTEGGGTNDVEYGGDGTVFKISPNGALSSLYSFTGGNDPAAALVQGRDGSFYGTTGWGGTNECGNVFKISSSGALTNLYSFTGVNDGLHPQAGLVQATDGNFYGTTGGGAGDLYNASILNIGSVFKISPNGVLTSLYSFTGTNDGASPQAALVQGSDGNFYGTTEFNYHKADLNFGFYGAGTVFKISANGALTTLYSFTGGNDGGNPQAALVQGSDGSFYGTTSGGGAGGGGTVFRLTIVPQPQLSIIPSGPYVILTWPTDYAGFSYAGYTLQSTTNLGSSAVWTTNSPPPVVIGGENIVINTTTTGKQQFYRLSQ